MKHVAYMIIILEILAGIVMIGTTYKEKIQCLNLNQRIHGQYKFSFLDGCSIKTSYLRDTHGEYYPDALITLSGVFL